MAYDGGTAIVRVVADAKGLNASLAAATRGAEGTFGKLGQSITKALSNPLVLAGAGLGAAVTVLGYQFEQAFTKISAVSNASAKDIEGWKSQVLSLSRETAQAPEELADALFFLASAGLQTGQVMEVLESSAQASAVGLGDTADVAKLTANVLNAYADSGITAAQVTDTLVAAVREGTADTDEFTAAIGRVLPIASRAKVGFDQIVGSLAALSNIGLDVNEGVTALRGLLQAIVAPTEMSQRALKKLHITTEELRGTLEEEGLPGALKLLETASKGNIDVLRQLIPNIRALTGELGLTGENADQVALIMIATANAAGSLSKALDETAKGPAFQFDKAVNDIRVAGTELGTKILPALTKAIEVIGPLLAFAAKNALALGLAFVTWKVLQGLSSLLASLAVSLQATATGATATTAAMTGASVAMGGFTLATAAATAGIGLLAYAIANSKFGQVLNDAISPALQSVADLAQAAELSRRSGLSFADALLKIRDAAKAAAEDTGPVDEALDGLRTHLDKTGQRVRNFAGMTTAALRDFSKQAVEDFSNVGGSLSDTGAVFTTSANEVIRGINRIAEAQKRMAKDLQKLDDIKIGDKLKARLIELGPQAVDGFVRGTAKQRGAIREGLKAYDRAAEDTNTAVSNLLKRGGTTAGRNFAAGAVIGTDSGAGLAAAAAARMGHQMIEALNQALEEQSPSKASARSGKFFVEGLIKGMEQNSKGLLRMVQKLGDLIKQALDDEVKDAISKSQLDFAKGLEKRIQGATRDLDKLVSKFRSFKDSIRSGFESLGDLGGLISGGVNDYREALKDWNTARDEAAAAGELFDTPEPGAFDIQGAIRAQVAQAQLLAKTLADAAEAGLSKGLLAQFAGQGVDAIPALQELLANPELIGALNQAQQQIAQAAGQTADALGERFFGHAIRNASKHLDHLADALVRFIARLQRLFGDVSAGVQKQLDAIQQQAQQTQKQTGGGGGGFHWTGGFGGGGHNYPGNTPPTSPHGGGGAQTPNVTVNVNGWVGNDQKIAEKVRDELLRVQRNNNTTGIR